VDDQDLHRLGFSAECSRRSAPGPKAARRCSRLTRPALGRVAKGSSEPGAPQTSPSSSAILSAGRASRLRRTALDALHLRKIDLADRVLVVNPGGYIGESTSREIAYAHATGKPISFTEPV
jgi:hypothetical protein